MSCSSALTQRQKLGNGALHRRPVTNSEALTPTLPLFRLMECFKQQPQPRRNHAPHEPAAAAARAKPSWDHSSHQHHTLESRGREHGKQLSELT